VTVSSLATALYVRVSTADQGVDSQVEELQGFCRGRSYAKVRLFVEKESGAKVTRPQLDAMMTDVRSGKVARVVVYKLDRLGRSLTHLALILDELQRLGVSLICTSQGIDTSGDNPAGRLQLGVLMAVAEFERSLIRERVNAGLRAAKGRGMKLGRPTTLANRREEILQLKALGVGLRETARRLAMPASSVAKVLKEAQTTQTDGSDLPALPPFTGAAGSHPGITG
jgi:DNA invertase Pin-like site-specific DNA recombinase